MKTLLIGLEGITPQRLLGDERLANVRCLMDVGLWGRLRGAASAEGMNARIEALCRHLTGGDWELVSFSEADDALLDGQIGRLLENLDEETVVLVLADHEGSAAFILAAPCLAEVELPKGGEIDTASVTDLAVTLLELAGRDVPHEMQGRSLIQAMANRACDGDALSEEDIIRQRLIGLGYI